MQLSTPSLYSPELEHVITQDYVIVSPSTSLLEVIGYMTQVNSSCDLVMVEESGQSIALPACPVEPELNRRSCALVMANNQLLGLFTERDLVKLTAAGQSLGDVLIADVMTRSPLTIAQDQVLDIATALFLFRQHQIRHLPVLDLQGQPVGLITPEGIRRSLQPANLLQLRCAVEVMNPAVVHASPTTSVLQLAHLMVARHVSCVVIVTPTAQGQLQPLGIVTERDIVQFQALHLDLAQMQAQSIMSTPLFGLKPADSLLVVHEEMQRRRLRRLVVMGQEGELLGIVTQTSLLQSLDPVEMYRIVDLLHQEVEEHSAQLRHANEQLQLTLLERERIEAALKTANEQLEARMAERTAELERQNLRSRLVAETALKIRQSLNLEEILQTTVIEVRDLLTVDRVLIFRLQSGGAGTVVTEAVVPGVAPILSQGITDDCLSSSYLQTYRQGRIYCLSDIETEAVPECLVDFLRQMQVRAKLVMPILLKEELWGLLIIHQCNQPRQWTEFEVGLLQQLADHLSIALTHAELMKSQREGEEKFRNLVEQTTDWVWEMDQNAKFTYVSPRAQSILGYEVAEVLGKSIFDLMPAAEAEQLLKIFNFFKSKQQPFTQLEATLIHQQGQLVILETSGSPILDSQGILQGYRGIARDITGRKQVDRQIRQALEKEKELNQLKSRFVSMTSHEFRTPLSIILSSAELLEHYSHNWAEQRKVLHCQRIQAAVKTMTQLLEDVLLLGSADAGKLKFQPALLDVTQFCQDVIEDLQASTDKNYKLIFTGQPTNQGAYLDEKLLRSILNNLLSNAIKYSPVEGIVQLELDCHLTAVIFRVSDQGIGIPLEDQKYLFESFHRAENVGTIPGTGLGLAIVKRCVDLHKGTISVASQVDVGTTFTITLPATPEISIDE